MPVRKRLGKVDMRVALYELCSTIASTGPSDKPGKITPPAKAIGVTIVKPNATDFTLQTKDALALNQMRCLANLSRRVRLSKALGQYPDLRPGVCHCARASFGWLHSNLD
jgi:hypothetical protein